MIGSKLAVLGPVEAFSGDFTHNRVWLAPTGEIPAHVKSIATGLTTGTAIAPLKVNTARYLTFTAPAIETSSSTIRPASSIGSRVPMVKIRWKDSCPEISRSRI